MSLLEDLADQFQESVTVAIKEKIKDALNKHRDDDDDDDDDHDHYNGHDAQEQDHTYEHQHAHPKFNVPVYSSDQDSDTGYGEPPKMPEGSTIMQHIPGSDRSFHISDCRGNKKALLIGINYIGMPIALKGKQCANSCYGAAH